VDQITQNMGGALKRVLSPQKGNLPELAIKSQWARKNKRKRTANQIRLQRNIVSLEGIGKQRYKVFSRMKGRKNKRLQKLKHLSS